MCGKEQVLYRGADSNQLLIGRYIGTVAARPGADDEERWRMQRLVPLASENGLRGVRRPSALSLDERRGEALASAVRDLDDPPRA